MSTPATPSKPAAKTIAEWLATPEDDRYELIDGELIQKAAPTFEHGLAQLALGGELRRTYGRKPSGPNEPGGWRFASEVDIELDGQGYRPDLAGWRRARLPTVPKARPVDVRPDWICEVVSESNRTVDTVKKVRRYHQGGVPHYWILNQLERSLLVHRHSIEGYVLVLAAEATEVVRAEPFEAIELEVSALFGDDE